MITVAELLRNNGIDTWQSNPGRQYLTCPRCSALRKRHNQKKRCLSLMIEDAERAYWKCHHCGWSGPEKGSSYGLDGRTRYEYPNGNYKVKSTRGFTWEHESVDLIIRSGAKGLENILYRIEEARDAGGLVAVVEGEKDAETLWKLGVPAVTSAHGAAKPGQKPKWNAEHSRQLQGLDIVVLNDNDEQGYAHAAAVVECSVPFAKSIRRLDLKEWWPGGTMPVGADISDYEAEVGGREGYEDQIREMIRNAPMIGKTTASPGQDTAIFTVADLEHQTFEETQMVIQDLFVEGLTLFAAKPKTGKSWLMLHAALQVAQFGKTLGQLQCNGGDVLYCALEDNKRRLKTRITKLAIGWPARLFMTNSIPRLASGGLKIISDWISSAIDPRLVIIDTLEMVRERPKNGDTSYASDYTALLDLRKIANDKHIAIVAVHHLRKAEAEDPFDTISGTLGLTGAVDAILVMTRDGTGATTSFTLHGKGRDLEEFERPLTFDRTTCTWAITGPTPKTGDQWARKPTLTTLKRALDTTLAEHGKPARPWPDGPEVQAADLEDIRQQFYRTHTTGDDLTDKPQAMQKAFKRAITTALNHSLIATMEINGSQTVWLATQKR